MVPKIGSRYLLWYSPYPSFFRNERQEYVGSGIYSGKSTIQSDGLILYWFEDESGNSIGWFSSDDIFFL
jgi:hypothetical protein